MARRYKRLIRICRICKDPFKPDYRVPHQRVCSKPQCQRERHRIACKIWRQHNRWEARQAQADRIVQKIVSPIQPKDDPSYLAAELSVNWEAIQDQIGVYQATVLLFLVRRISLMLRDEMRKIHPVKTAGCAQLPRADVRDEIPPKSG